MIRRSSTSRVRRRGALPAIALLFLSFTRGSLAAPTLSDLFQRVKLQVAAADFSGALETLGSLEAEAAKPENASARATLTPAAAFYRGVCLASLGREAEARAQFTVYIAAHPDKSIDRSAYSKTVVSVFDEAQKSARSRSVELPSLATAYRATAFHEPVPPASDWASGPAKFLLTEEEIRAFIRIADNGGRADFVSRFWAGSDPDARDKRERFRREFERRAAFADEYFSEGKTRGSLTDRGMVFVLLGPPSGIFRRPISAADDSPSMLTMNSAASPPPRSPVGNSLSDQPSNWKEVWRYNRDLLPAGAPYQQVDFMFQTRIDYGRNVLQREPSALRTLDEARKQWRSAGP